MTDIAELGIRIDSRQLRQGGDALDDFARRGANAEVSAESLMGVVKSLGKGLAGLALIVKAMDFGDAIVRAQRDFDKLNASLITATGSVGNAGQAFAALQRFAATTPYSLKEVSDGFIKLRNLGLTPSERALQSYGNTASAMGKSLNQLVEAVADAATGEFERLKEFGIKSKNQGDTIAFTFQGTTTTVANNAAAIEGYLMKLGEVQFAGGMELQASTLDGAISNLADTWDMTLLAFAQTGFGDAVMASTLALAGALTDLQAIIRSTTGDYDDQKKAIQELRPLHDALTEIFTVGAVAAKLASSAVTALTANVEAYWAVLQAAMKGQHELIPGILTARKKQMEEEAQMTNAQVEKIRWAAAVAEKVRENERAAKEREKSDDLARYAIVTKAVQTQTAAQKKSADEAANWAKKTLEAGRDTISVMQAELAAFGELGPEQKKSIAIRADLVKYAKLLSPEIRKNIAAQRDEIDAQERMNQELELYLKLMDDRAAAGQRDIDAATDSTKSLLDQVKYYGLTEAAVLRLQLAELQRKQQNAGDNALEQNRLFQLIAATEDQIALQEKLGKMKANADFWTSLESTAHSTFTSIFDGSKNAAERIRDTFKNILFDWLYQMTIKKWIINLQADASASGLPSIIGAVSGSGSSAGGTGVMGNASSLISAGRMIYQGFTTGLSGTVGGMVTQFGNLLGSQAVSAFGTGLGLTGAQAGAASGAYAAAGNATAASGISAGAGAAGAIPIIGWIISGMMANNKFFKQGWNIDGQTGDIAKSLLGSTLKGNPFGALGATATVGINAANSLLKKIGLNDQMASLISGSSLWTRAFGHQKPTIETQGIQGTISASGFSGEAFANILQKGGWFRSDKRSTQTAALSTDTDANFDNTILAMVAAVKGFGSAIGAETSVIDGYSKAIKLTLTNDEAKNQELIAAAFGGVADDLATLLVPSIAKFTAEGETASTTLQRIATDFANVTTVLDSMGVTSLQAFGAVGVATIEARERLIAMAGGIDALAQQTDFFTQNFMTDAERIAPVQKAVSEQLAALGYTGVSTSDQFKAAVMGLATSGALATEAGAKTYAGLLALAPAFKQVSDYTDGLAKAAADLAAQQALEDAAKAAEEAQRAAKLTQDRRALEIQIMELSGDAVGALAATRADELASVNETLRPLYERIYALQDEQAAAEKAAQAAAEVAQALQSSADALRGIAASALADLQRSVAAQKDAVKAAFDLSMVAIGKSIDTINASIAKTTALSQSLKSTLSGMSVQGNEGVNRAAAQAQIQSVLAIAKAGGALPDVDSIKDALALASKSDTSDFATFLDYQRDFARTASSIQELSDLTDTQLTAEQRQLALLTDQKDLLQKQYDAEVARLDGILEKAQEQIDVLNGIATGVQTIPSALAAFAAAIQAAMANPINGAATQTQAAYSQYLGRDASQSEIDYWKGQAANGVNVGAAVGGSDEARIQALYRELLGRSGDAAGVDAWEAALAAGQSWDQIRGGFMSSDEYQKLHPKGFASGGSHAGGWRVVGENGPELENTAPSRIYSNSASSDLFGGLEVRIQSLETVMATGLSRLIAETKRGSDAVENLDERGVLQRDEMEIG
ncbi:uncharacterized protein DUF4214 [Pseudoduganella lurida]|uniref:Uncharacterized protein DUF4214 n=1 Tax=Pseudoduganella lurida TaxID=1036180 RepID=A0A562RIZ6_9BURK|nr:DUF4214 domain-containing protein [Pseudoduganella lurida]TWI69062.1 uncharacterized protein DUF4214 [Pseudoduganella lurida]